MLSCFSFCAVVALAPLCNDQDAAASPCSGGSAAGAGRESQRATGGGAISERHGPSFHWALPPGQPLGM